MGKTYEALKRAAQERAKAKEKEAKGREDRVEAESPGEKESSAGPPMVAASGEEKAGWEPAPKGSWLRQFFGSNGKNGYRPGRNGAGQQPFEMSFSLAPEIEEAYQTLGTSLLVAKNRPKVRNLMVVSAKHGEGATTTAALFAASLARRKAQKILLVESNFRSPALDQVFSIKRNGGFAELIEGKLSLEEVIQKTELANLFVMTCGHSSSPSPLQLLDSPKVGEVLEQLAEGFEFVIFDCPPVSLYSDACVIGARLDAAVFVVESDVTRIDEARHAKGQLERAGVNLLGVVLNRQKQYIPSFIESML